MHYVKLFTINGVDTKQVACIELQGSPNAATEGAVGVLGMDMTSPTHEVYRCVAVNGSVYTWELLSAGMSIVSATITREGAEVTSFAYTNLKIPSNYLLKAGDLILDTDGYLYQVSTIGSDSCNATYSGTHLGGAGTGEKDCRLDVSGGKLRLVTENGNVLSEVDFLTSDEATLHRDPSTGKACVAAIKTVNDTLLHIFVGTQAEYNALTEDQRQNLFAIITGKRAPMNNTAHKLTSSGYYHVSMVVRTPGRDGVTRDYRYNFGLVYWDGVNECALPAIENFFETYGGGDNIRICHGYINSSGDIKMWSCDKTGTSHTNITGDFKIYTIKIGE